MYKKIMYFFLAMVILFLVPSQGFALKNNNTAIQLSTEKDGNKGEKDSLADNITAKNNGKVVVIDISRTSLENFSNIKYLREKIKSNGYIALMNIRGDKGYDDRRNFATMGATTRANISSDIQLDFSSNSKKGDKIYEAATAQKSGKINLNNINNVDSINLTTGDYKSGIGYLGETLKANGKAVSVIGNCDYIENENIVKNRDFCLTFMDTKGRLFSGNVDDINMENLNFPFGISTDYAKLKDETKKYYSNSDLLYVNLGDTYRLDKYKPNLNAKTYKKMKFSIYDEVSEYIEYVFNMVD